MGRPYKFGKVLFYTLLNGAKATTSPGGSPGGDPPRGAALSARINCRTKCHFNVKSAVTQEPPDVRRDGLTVHKRCIGVNAVTLRIADGHGLYGYIGFDCCRKQRG